MSRALFPALRVEGAGLWDELLSPWRSCQGQGLSQEMAGAELANGIAREQFRQLMHKSKANLIASVLGLLLWVIALLSVGAGWIVGLWAAVLLAIFGRIAYLTQTFVRRSPSDAELRRWEARLGRVVSVSVVAWGSIGLVHPFTEDRFVPYMAIGLLLVVAGSLGLFANYRPSTAWLALPLGVLTCAIVVAGHRGPTQLIGVGFLIATAVLTFMARTQNSLVSRNMMNAAERLELIREAERLREEAAYANRAKTRALASVAHDLRQPMHSISLLTSRLAEHADHRASARSQIHASVHAMAALLTALKEASAISNENQALQVRAVALGDVFDSLQRQLAPQAREQGIDYRVMACGVLVHTDPFQLQRILRNLVSNAIQCTRDGCVMVRAKVRASRAIVQVWDSGPGIPRQHRDIIFDEFYQMPQARRTSGLGLGLATVKHLANRLGHRMHVRSRVGQCSLFSIELPLCGEPAGPAHGFQEWR